MDEWVASKHTMISPVMVFKISDGFCWELMMEPTCKRDLSVLTFRLRVCDAFFSLAKALDINISLR